MKVILKEDVPSLGLEGDVVDVASGYARNHLLPKSLAIVADKGNLKTWEKRREILAKRREGELEEARKQASELESRTFKIFAPAGKLAAEKGKSRLHGSITEKDIVETIREDKNISLDKKSVLLKEKIKTTGTYLVAIKLHPQVETNVKIEVAAAREQKASSESSKKKK